MSPSSCSGSGVTRILHRRKVLFLGEHSLVDSHLVEAKEDQAMVELQED